MSVHPGVNFLRAVRSADRSGHSAMAVVVENASDGTTLAVDTRDMGQVMSWPPGLGAGGSTRVAQQLIPTGLAPPVELSGSALRVSLNARVAAQPAPQLSLDLFDQGFQAPQQVVLGDLVAGHRSYEASIAGLCPETCTLSDLAVTWAPSSTATTPTGTAQVEISSISDLHGSRWKSVSAGLRRARRWTSPTGGAQLAASSDGLSALFTLNPDAAPVAIAPADIPASLPTVLTTTAAAVDSPSGGPSLIVGLDGASVKAHAIAEVPALPRVGDDAALVDLGMAQRVLSGPFVDDTPEVWLSTNAPADISSRLASEGISVVGMDSVTERQAASVHGSVNLAYALFLIAGLIAAALAIGTTAFALGRRRPAARCGTCRHVGHRHPRGVAPPLERGGASAGARHRAALRGRRRSRGSSSRPEIYSGVRRTGTGTTARNSTPNCAAGGTAALLWQHCSGWSCDSDHPCSSERPRSRRSGVRSNDVAQNVLRTKTPALWRVASVSISSASCTCTGNPAPTSWLCGESTSTLARARWWHCSVPPEWARPPSSDSWLGS